jgi:beta-glucuronidase
MKRDLDIAFHMGCNSIRGSHYPNSRVFVDMLDQSGMTFWSEIPIWGCGFSTESLADSVVLKRGLEMHREMVKYYYNHPCIILWGMHNEIKVGTQAAYDMSKLYYTYLKENGGNRLATFATHQPLDAICLEFCDIISINRYVGWYYGKRNEWEQEVEAFRQRREALGLTDKPVLYSEFGSAAIYGHHTFDDLKWTEEYQAKLISDCLHLFHKDPMVAGFYFWQFCDIRTCAEATINRARHYNNKGVLNEYRRPKLAYYAVREAYRAFEQEEAQK